MTQEASTKPIIIAHRGASGYLPEHTLEAYQRAIDLGADYIEPDLVLTKDGVLVARHDIYLGSTTDIATHPEFADRRKKNDGHEGEDWFVEDFTLDELKTLRAVQPRPDRDQSHNGAYQIPTFDEILALAMNNSTKDRRIGVYPETKQPAHFEARGLFFDDVLLESLEKTDYRTANDPVFIQSFEADILKRMKERTTIRLIFLTEELPAVSMSDIRTFADGIGPYKRLIADAQGNPTGFLDLAHEAGLDVHPWTFRDDDLPTSFETGFDEIHYFLKLGVDGVFTDFPDTGHAARDAFASGG